MACSCLARRSAPRTLRELARHDGLTLSHRQGRNLWRLQGPRGSQAVAINRRFAVYDRRVLAQACMAGLDISLLPQWMAEPMIAQGRLVRVLPNYRRASTELGMHLVYASRPPVPPAVVAVVDFLWENGVWRWPTLRRPGEPARPARPIRCLAGLRARDHGVDFSSFRSSYPCQANKAG
ncbi:LysR substrate-binding domain-containing protein [Dyella japonica]|uniref:LysR substrate-binding domain-containing protein n=1 Tax=Dyella japonica TaxID=231455 RepID=UPI000371211C|nr:LysR substrate-binding domain-containing protein [Dyella japonica]